MSLQSKLYQVIQLLDAVDVTSTGDKVAWVPGLFPGIIRGVAVHFSAEPTVGLVLKLDKINGVGTRGDGDGGVVTGSAGDDIRDVLYKQDMNTLVLPGEKIVFEVTTGATGASSANLCILVEWSMEMPANNTRMNKSST